MTNRFTAFFVLCCLLAGAVYAQTSVPAHLLSQPVSPGQTPAETAVLIGKQLIGAPYVANTLDQNATEQLVVNLQTFDCTTFLETVLALALTQHTPPASVMAAASAPASRPITESVFRTYLTQLRYRNGRIEGYVSRLHYFSDWLRDNERRGLVADVTNELPGRLAVSKPLSYMTSSVYRYPALTDPAIFKQIAQTEADLSQQVFSFIPRQNIRKAESQLRDGDIVMLMAARPGLDMKHVGLAVRQPNGRVHLLHASSEQGRVMLTAQPLSDYVLAHKRLSGIRIARLRTQRSVATAMLSE